MQYKYSSCSKERTQKKEKMVLGKYYLQALKGHPFEQPNALLVVACILKKSNLIMHLII